LQSVAEGLGLLDAKLFRPGGFAEIKLREECVDPGLVERFVAGYEDAAEELAAMQKTACAVTAWK